MLDAKAGRFYQAALQSGLIDEAGLEACWALIPAEKRTVDAVDRRLARQAISSNRLTLWQAQQLLAGRSTGFKIDKYVLLDLLGRGGMGRVYLAKDTRLDRLVAVKILSQERMDNPRAIARFRREAKVGAQLQHENLVRVYDEGDAGGIRYLVMEYIEGKNVGQLITELGVIPWPTAARLTRQVALGLDHARLKGLIHRDVNPCNILVTHDGSAKLTDLGLAIDLADQDNVTRDGATVGTFDYVSPEQAKNSRSVDTRADIYSLGCTIYHMIVGHVPFPVVSLPEKLYAHQLRDPEPIADLVPGVPEGLAEVIRRMMRKLPDERYQNPLEVAQALEPFAIESGWTSTAQASPSGSSSGMRDGTSSRSPMAVAVAKAASPSVVASPAASGATSWALLGAPATTPAPESTTPKSVSETGSGSIALPSTNGLGGAFLPLDLGPELSLSAGLKSSPKVKAYKLKPKVEGAGAGDRRRKLGLIAAAVAGVVVALGTVAGLVAFAMSGSGSSTAGVNVPKQPEDKSKKPTAPPLAEGAIVIRFRSGDSEAVPTLAEAIARSVRDRAEVILAAGSTVRLSNEKTIRVPDGSLSIRSADGGVATIEIKVKGSQPTFLSNANIRLTGLSVVVNYDTASDAPVIQAERDLILDRCLFQAKGPPEGSRLALAEGPKVSITGCLFEGFDCPIDILASPGMSATIKQSIFVAPKAGDELTGRAARVRSAFGQGTGCKLKVEDCSARVGVFLEAARFAPESPLTVEIATSALLVKSLLEYDGTEKSPDAIAKAVAWDGRDNRYQLAPPGDAWATLAGGEKLPGGPTDLDAWSKLAKEAGTKIQPLKLAKDPPAEASPKDAVLVGEDGKPVGADPAMVGPR